MTDFNYKQFLIKEGVYDPGIFKAYFLAGGPGSGKTFVTQSAFAGLGLKLVNSDSIFEKYLRDAGLSLKMPDSEKSLRDPLRQKAKIKTGARLDLYLKGRLGIIIDSTARDTQKIIRQQKILKILGYDTYMIFVNTSLDVALARNKARERSVPEYITISSHKQIQNSMGLLQKSFSPGNFYVIDNNRSEKELVTQTLKTASSIIRRTYTAPPKSHIAKAWIKSQLDTKKR